MARISATVNQDTNKALEEVEKTTRLPRAEILRIAIEAYLRDKGYELDGKVQWGGKRAASSDTLTQQSA